MEWNTVYYTANHEWIIFRGEYAEVGISNIRFLGFSSFQEITFTNIAGFKFQGEIIGWIKYPGYKLPIQMPTNGSIIQVNRLFRKKNPKLTVKQLEQAEGMFTMIPEDPQNREELIHSIEYLSMIKEEYHQQ